MIQFFRNMPKWWTQFWNKSDLKIPDQLLEKTGILGITCWDLARARGIIQCRSRVFGRRITENSPTGMGAIIIMI